MQSVWPSTEELNCAELIAEVLNCDIVHTYDNELPVIECEVDDDKSYASNMAIVGEYYN